MAAHSTHPHPRTSLNIFINHPSPYLTDFHPHGDGLLAYKYIDELARRGHHIYVAAPFARLSKELHPNIHLTMIETGPAGSADLSRLQRIQYALGVRKLLGQLRRSVHLDIIHQLNPATSWVHLFLPLHKTPFIVGPVPSPWPEAKVAVEGRWKHGSRWILRQLVRRELFGKAKRILVPVPSAQQYLEVTKRTRRRVSVLHYGVDTTLFAPKTQTNSTQTEPHILFLANLEKRKGIYTLLQAFTLVAASIPHVRLTIAGDGTERERICQEINSMAAANKISMIGSVHRSKIVDVLNSCTLFCLPSYGEPFGMSALEAMACGKPVVVTAAGGLDDLVQPEGGIKVPVGDAQSLAEALIQLASQPDLCNRMGEYNRSLAVSLYDWTSVIDHLEDIYQQVIHT